MLFQKGFKIMQLFLTAPKLKKGLYQTYLSSFLQFGTYPCITDDLGLDYENIF